MIAATRKAAARENASSGELALADAIRRLRNGEPGAEEALRTVIGPGIRFLLHRAVGPAATPRLVEETLILACHELRWGRISSAAGIAALVREARFRRGAA